MIEARSGAEVLGLDVEGDGFFRYRSRLCTLQIGDAASVDVVDTLAIEDLSAMARLLGPEGPVKIVHDVSFDNKMLASRGLPLGNVFDTSVAARFLGEPNTGLAALLAARFDVKLDKKYQRADWGARPLTDDQLAYLAADVVHLPELARQLREAAAAVDILEEIDEETRYAMDRALDPEVERAPWTRIKNARELSGQALAVLVALADVREEAARDEDVPPFRITSNAVLFEAARRHPRRVADLRRIRGLSALSDAALSAALEAAERDGPPSAEPSEPPPPPEVRAERKAREKRLGQWRTEEAKARRVDLQVVLPGHCLRDLAGMTAPDLEKIAATPGLGAKRLAKYGERLLETLRAADAAA